MDLTPDRLNKKSTAKYNTQNDQTDNNPIPRLLSVFFIYWELEAKGRVYKNNHAQKKNEYRNFREMQQHQAKL